MLFILFFEIFLGRTPKITQHSKKPTKDKNVVTTSDGSNDVEKRGKSDESGLVSFPGNSEDDEAKQE